jgi:hypothetical protein
MLAVRAAGAAHRRAPVTDTTPLTTDERAELEALRRRVAALEDELHEQARRTNAVVAAAQERAYWLERWRVDLNAIMERPAAGRVRAAARAVRGPFRLLRRLKRRLVG